jgi:hypothetical protein
MPTLERVRIGHHAVLIRIGIVVLDGLRPVTVNAEADQFDGSVGRELADDGDRREEQP